MVVAEDLFAKDRLCKRFRMVRIGSLESLRIRMELVGDVEIVI